MKGSARKAGFSLLEAIVVVAVLAILLALALPAMQSVRRVSSWTVSKMRLGENAKLLNAYAAAHADAFPVSFLTPRGEVRSTTRAAKPRYFEQSLFWHWPVAAFAGLSPISASFRSGAFGGDSISKDAPAYTDFAASCAFLADAQYWSDATRVGPAQWRGQRLSDVRDPSLKIMLLDFSLHREGPVIDAAGPERSLLALVDASVREALRTQIRDGYRWGDGPTSLQGVFHPADIPRGTHTVNGVAGRDL